MTVRTIKTTPNEAQKIMENKTSGIFRSAKEFFSEGDIINFMVVRERKPVTHTISNRSYIVTEVKDCMQCPVEKGYQYVGFRRMA